MLTDKTICKIGHGTDSLDIPALYKYINDKEKIIQFTNSLYDTRFLCEYINTFTPNKLCNIYFSIKYFNVVKEKQIIIKSQGEKLSRDLEYYCEAFTQSDASRNQRGYGLGLSIVKRILERHDFKLLYFYENSFKSLGFKTIFSFEQQRNKEYLSYLVFNLIHIV